MRARNPRRLPRDNPTSSTPKFCKVKGTGVKGRGRVTRAQSATNMLALTMITIWRVISNARLVAIAWAADLVIHPPRKTRLRFVVRLARVFFRGNLGVYVTSDTKEQR